MHNVCVILNRKLAQGEIFNSNTNICTVNQLYSQILNIWQPFEEEEKNVLKGETQGYTISKYSKPFLKGKHKCTRYQNIQKPFLKGKHKCTRYLNI